MGEIPKASRSLTHAFHQAGMRIPRSPYFIDEKPCCWLAPHDPHERPCDGKWEAIHFIGRQQIRHCPTLHGIGDELLVLAEWDPRNAGLGCVAHHRPFDSHSTPTFEVPAEALPGHVIEFIHAWGLESEAERKFPGFVRL